MCQNEHLVDAVISYNMVFYALIFQLKLNEYLVN